MEASGPQPRFASPCCASSGAPDADLQVCLAVPLLLCPQFLSREPQELLVLGERSRNEIFLGVYNYNTSK